ncbi:MAG: sterol desaturase family protein [Alphaproteobacteria bacterium]|nr:sterol desaturase family protein [Alphaproteobacteria bacterium]
MMMLETLQEALAGPAKLLILPQAPVSFYYLLSAIGIATLLILWQRRRDDTTTPLVEKLFPKSVLLHRSAVFDYQYFFFSRVVWVLCFGILFFQSNSFAEAAHDWLLSTFGPISNPPQQGFLTATIVTAVYVVVYDFCYWFFHWLLHKLPWLWAFHKGHHSAEVLTPFTAIRSHPVEEIINANFIALGTGLSYGLMSYIFGTAPQALELMRINLFMLVYYLAFYNLRHSHIWLPITGRWGAIIQSPAHHQIHHSTSPEHIDKNFGYCLAVWDWLFGTLYVPKREENFALGIGKESPRYHAMLPFLLLPFQDIARWFRERCFAPRHDLSRDR